MKKYLALIIALPTILFYGCKKELPEVFDGEPVFFYQDANDTSIQFYAGLDNYILEASLTDNRPGELLIMSGVFKHKTDSEADFLRLDLYGNTSMVGALTALDLTSNSMWSSYSIDSIVQNVPVEQFYFRSNTPGSPSISWDFGDGSTGMGDSLYHTYTSGGAKNVQMTAQYTGGCGVPKIVTNSIITDPFSSCRINFTYTKNGANFTFNAVPAPGSNFTVYNWDFGNGQTGSGQSTQVTYTDSLDHLVSLTASNGMGCTETFTALLNSTNTCQASYYYTTVQGQAQVFAERLNENTAVITYRKNGIIYRSYRADPNLNQSSNSVFTLNGANFYEQNAQGQQTVQLQGSIATTLYNVLNANDSISLNSGEVSIAVAIPN